MPRGPRGERRPADVIGAAVMAARIATGEVEDDPKTEKTPTLRPWGRWVGRRAARPALQSYAGNACAAYAQYTSTSFTERHNLTMRMQMRRFTRLTNGLSKKFDNHCHALALYFVWYNFVKLRHD
jgi:hypothetical protein